MPYATFPVKRLAIRRPVRTTSAHGLGQWAEIIGGVLSIGAKVYEMKQQQKMQKELLKAQEKAKAQERAEAEAERKRQEDERKRQEEAARQAAAEAKAASEQKAIEIKQQIEEEKAAPLINLSKIIPEGAKTYLYVGGGLALLGIAYLIYSRKKSAKTAAATKTA